MTGRHARRWVMAIVAFSGVGLVGAPPAGAAMVKIAQELTPTGVDADASGKSKVTVAHRSARPIDGRLQVNGRRLKGTTTYGVSLDGVRIGTFTTNRGGSGHARFRSAPGVHDQLLGVDPRGTTLDVSDDDGDDVLEVEIPDAQDPSHVRCCLVGHDDDGGETECEDDLASADCLAAGGTDLGAGSCLPDPCGGSTGGPLVRCCIPQHDDDGPECESKTAAGCSEHHGINLGEGSCDPNPCPPPPPGDVIRCCLADDHHHGGDGEHGESLEEGPGGAECEHESALECGARGGQNLGAGSCEPNPCPASPSGAFLDVAPSLF